MEKSQTRHIRDSKKDLKIIRIPFNKFLVLGLFLLISIFNSEKIRAQVFFENDLTKKLNQENVSSECFRNNDLVCVTYSGKLIICKSPSEYEVFSFNFDTRKIEKENSLSNKDFNKYNFDIVSLDDKIFLFKSLWSRDIFMIDNDNIVLIEIPEKKDYDSKVIEIFPDNKENCLIIEASKRYKNSDESVNAIYEYKNGKLNEVNNSSLKELKYSSIIAIDSNYRYFKFYTSDSIFQVDHSYNIIDKFELDLGKTAFWNTYSNGTNNYFMNSEKYLLLLPQRIKKQIVGDSSKIFFNLSLFESEGKIYFTNTKGITEYSVDKEEITNVFKPDFGGNYFCGFWNLDYWKKYNVALCRSNRCYGNTTLFPDFVFLRF
ncbi:MAG: hypothetical protein PHN88_15065 [Ignavibacteria bacterium]|nr:hypothetical protein [Ignavibacteria bacterium]